MLRTRVSVLLRHPLPRVTTLRAADLYTARRYRGLGFAPSMAYDAYRGIRLRNLLSADAARTTFQQRDHASVFEPKARMRGWKR